VRAAYVRPCVVTAAVVSLASCGGGVMTEPPQPVRGLRATRALTGW
jgi:hypothetical protein